MKKIETLLIILFLLMMSACNGTLVQDEDDIDTMNQTNESEERSMVEMTDEEKRLLAAVYPNGRDIQEGNLFHYQEEALESLRYGMRYLSEKYPSYPMTCVLFEPANKFNQHAVLWFHYQDEDNSRVIITPEADSYRCEDTFYAVLLEPEYNRMIEEALENNGIHVKAFSTFPNPVGGELREGSTAEDIAHLKGKTSKIIHLYIEAQNEGEIIDVVREVLDKARYGGSYTVYTVPDLETLNESDSFANNKIASFSVEE